MHRSIKGYIKKGKPKICLAFQVSYYLYNLYHTKYARNDKYILTQEFLSNFRAISFLALHLCCKGLG